MCTAMWWGCWALCTLLSAVGPLCPGVAARETVGARAATWGTRGWSSGKSDGSGDNGDSEDVYIAGLFPMARDVPEGEIGRGVMPAVELALQHINNDSSLLQGYTLRMIWNDSRCDMAVATRAFFDMMDDENTTKVILFGDACYSVTGPLAQISQWWNMTQISYADTNPLLSDRDKYPNFFRTVPSDTDFNAARMALLRQFNWTMVGTIFQDASKGTARFSYAHNKLITLLERHRIDISEVTSFADDPEAAVQGLKNEDVRIILGNFDESMARRVFCSAHKRGLFGSRHQWIILGGYSHDWWRVPDPMVTCSPAQLNLTIQGYMATEPLPLSSSDHVTSWGLTPGRYAELYREAGGSAYSHFHGYTYDAVWTVAMALHRLQKMTAGQSQHPHAWLQRLDGGSLAKVLNDTNYLGVTGRVQFNRGDRVGQIKVLQMQGGTMTKIGEYYADTDDLDLTAGEPIYWRGGNRPMDRNVQRQEMKRVSVAVYAGLSVLAAIGIYMAVAFLAVNIMFRNHRFIKMSSPNMNNLIIVGCILCYHSVFLLGMDGAVVSPPYFPYLCGARAWILALGFTLAFGAMFSKTWRVHAIFTNIKLSRKVIKDYKLFLIVCVLVLLDAGILISWQVVDPLHRATKAQEPLVYDDYELIPVLEYCTSRHIEIWMGSIYAYKGLLLMFGCFLAWETRHVSIPALNDSKYIGLSVYNVVIMCVCGAAVSFIIKDQPNQSFIIIALFIIFCTTITLCLVFVPKIIELRRDPKGEDKRVRATLKKNTKSNGSDDSDLQRRIKNIADENLNLRQTLSERASEVAGLLEQLGEEVNAYDLGLRSAVHRKVLELRLTDNSPSKLSRVSTGSEADGSTYSEVSATTTLWTTDSPPPHRPSKSRLLAERLRVEVIEMADLRNKSGPVKSTRFLEAEDETDEDDPFGGVYLGPPDPVPEKRKSSDHNNVGYEQPPGGVPGSSRPRLESEASSETERNRTEVFGVSGLAGLFPRARLSRDRRHSAPVNIWTIREAVEETECDVILEEPTVPSRAQVFPARREAASQTAMEDFWATPTLPAPCPRSPRRVTFVCDVLERI